MKKIFMYLKWVMFGLMIVFGLYFYSKLPDVIPVHWNFAGEADNFGSKTTHLIIMPLIVLGMMLLFIYLPKLDPKKSQYEKFAEVYELIQLLLVTFMTYIYLITILVGIDAKINVSYAVMVGMGAMFIIMGNYMGKIRQNYFVGIKTPWTLDNEEVWNKTHRLGGWCFVIAGLLFILQAVFGFAFFWLFIILLVMLVLVPIGYSYWLHKKISKK
jgi:uncharacterized membrane protein